MTKHLPIKLLLVALTLSLSGCAVFHPKDKKSTVQTSENPESNHNKEKYNEKVRFIDHYVDFNIGIFTTKKLSQKCGNDPYVF